MFLSEVVLMLFMNVCVKIFVVVGILVRFMWNVVSELDWNVL